MVKWWSRNLLIAAWVVCGVGWHPIAARADEWKPAKQREFASDDKRYVFRVSPERREAIPRMGFCKGELFEDTAGARRLVWWRYLINNTAPVRAYVSNSGDFVVTMDEWEHVGTLPVVIYERYGSLVCVHSLESLGLNRSSEHIECSVGSRWWNDNALILFGPKDEFLSVRLHWGEVLDIRLRDGRVLQKDDLEPNERRAFEKNMTRRAEKEVLRLLQSEDPEDRRSGAIHAGRLRIRDAEPRLRELLTDDASYAEGLVLRKTVYYVREAARKALEEMSGQAVGGSNPAASQPSP